MKKILVLWIFLMMFLLGCNREASNTVELLGCSKDDCKLVYDGVKYHTYDTKLKLLTEEIGLEDNDFQYRLSKNDMYVTYGNSITNQFKILKRKNEQFETVYSHKNNEEAIFPFAYVDNQYVFLVMNYTDNKQSFVGLFHLNDKNKLEQLSTEKNEKTKNIFGVSISSNNNIYILLYEDGVQNLYKTNLSLSNFDLIATDVTQNLSTLSGEVCYIKNQKLFCGKTVLIELQAKTVLTWVVGDQYILEVDDTGNYEVRDIKDKKLILSGTDFIGFDENLSEVTIYSEGRMEKLEG